MPHIEYLRDYCLSKPAATEDFPFGDDIMVFKVGGKAFLLTSLSNYISINVKCDPDRAVALRDQYSDVLPGFHMNKKHWNTLMLDGSLTDPFILNEIDHSYECVVNGLTRKIRAQLGI